ncbi:hypothetical protein ACJVDH_06135 [Pedobacter sp. AW1-32]|uniref:hypothetical protein n=1 Tax=Pedobacter sp. AW1-32 TaxID=3383026 RepID=UPI003FEF1164
MKKKDIIQALVGMMIMILTYWILFYQLSPKESHPSKKISVVYKEHVEKGV